MLPPLELTEAECLTFQELAAHHPYPDFRRRSLGMLALAYLELNRQVKLGNIRIPQVFHSQSREPVLSLTQRAGDPPAWIFNK